MTTPATMQKRRELAHFIETALAPESAVQGVIGIGSIASGLARPDSDIDALVFLEPFDLYEFKWRPADGTFHSSFSAGPGLCLAGWPARRDAGRLAGRRSGRSHRQPDRRADGLSAAVRTARH
jgi:hypothetical protein